MNIPKLLLLLGFVLIAQTTKAQGPVQPEAMQFEPVDVTDVVNLATGDFTYAIPILNVPGPEGDYPVTLSYHSGIGPNQPATWVGLGWALNPGAINRTISGYPDDYKGDVVKTHYEAASQSSWAISIGAGWGPVGINMTYDHYSGMVGVNGMVSVLGAINAAGGVETGGLGDLGKGFSADLNLSAGTGGVSANASLSGSRGIGKSGFFGVGSLSAGTNGLGLGGGISKGYGKHTREDGSQAYKGAINLVSSGASLSSRGLGGNFGIAGTGFSSVTSVSNGNFNQSSGSIKIPLPGDFWISLGFAKWKWTLSETYTEYSYGVLHQDPNLNDETTKNERYSTEEQLFPSKDAYNVAVQGLTGAFTPVFDYPYLLQDGKENDEKGKLSRVYGSNTFFSNTYSDNGAKFRFLDDTGLNFTNKQSLFTSNNFSQINATEYASKKITPHISSATGKIQGFTVTSPDGIIYEFRQPVYNLYQYSETKFDDGNSDLLNWNTLNGSFATSWLLTEVKGPDFVDRDSDNEVSNGDWGYWVKFNYDRISSPQIWRAPFVGYAQGNTQHTDQYSLGVREAYYLSSIETQTHKSVFDYTTSKNGKNANVDLNNFDQKINPKKRDDDYSFEFDGDYEWVETVAGNNDVILEVVDYFSAAQGQIPGNIPLCGLSERTFTKQDVNFTYNASTGLTTVSVPSVTACQNSYYYDSEANILALDFIDQTAITHRKLDSIRLLNKTDLSNEISKVSFDYDYSLRSESPSSTSTIAADGFNKGTLTLKQIHFYGQNDYLVSPPYRFTYANGAAPGAPLNPDFHKEHYDFWGSYRYTISSIHRNTSQVKGEADLSAAWSLTGIQMPTGSEIEIEYESDDFFQINNTYFLTDAKAFDILTGNSSGTTINSSDSFTNADFNNYTAGIIVEKHTTDETTDPNDPFRNTTESVTEYTTLGFYHIESVNQSTSNIVLDGTPVFNTSTGPGNLYSYIFVAVPTTIYGGGSRVKSVLTKNGNEINRTLYTYKDGAASSGVTASMPADYIELEAAAQIANNLDMRELYRSVFMDHEASYGRPNPGVIYSKVQVLNVDEDAKPVSGMTEYEFYTAKDNPYVPSYSDNHFYVVDNSGTYGKPKSVTYYEQYEDNSATNFRPLKRTETLYEYSNNLSAKANIYKSESVQENSLNKPLGVTQQKHVSKVEKDAGGFFEKGVEQTYLNVFGVGQVETEYFYNSATSGTPSSTLVSKARTIGYNAYTGVPIVSVQQSATDDDAIISKTVPASWKYPGMKTKNMLTQVFQETSYRKTIDIDNDVTLKAYTFQPADVVSSSITTWDNQWDYPIGNGTTVKYTDIWRKNDTYTFVADHLYVDYPATETGYKANTYPAVSSTFPWKMTSNIATYDGYGHALETVNEDGTFQSVVYDDNNHSLVKAVISNAKKSEVVYEDFETGGTSNTHARTGDRGSALTSATITTPSLAPIHGGNYKISMWVKSSGSYTINGTSYTGNGDWQFVTTTASNNQSISKSGSNASVDDISIIPGYASVSYFAYDPLTWKVTAMTGPDHRTSFYEYDDAGRLMGVRDQDKNLLQNNEYVYGQEHYITTAEANYNPGEAVNFTLTALKSGIQVSGNYKWNFGDGAGFETTSTTASHNYTYAGEYTISVTFTDTENVTRRTTQKVKVGSNLEAKLTILRTAYYGSSNDGYLDVEEPNGTGENFIRVFSTADVSGGVQPYTYQWYQRPNSSSSWTLVPNENSSFLNLGTSTTSSSSSVDIKLVVTDYDATSVEVIETISNID